MAVTVQGIDPRPVLEVEGIVKQFPGVKALRGVGLRLGAGEVLAVVGENGAGKSTLMKILAGVQTPDAGVVRLDGRVVRIDSVEEALRCGIALIHQELNLADNLTVGANLFLGREPKRLGLIDHSRIDRESRQFLAKVGLDVDPGVLVEELSLGHQQMVEIAKALSVNARVLIMDEPTSSLSQHEAEQLKRVIRDLSAGGVGIIYISHRLGEVRELAHRVAVLRDGENVGELRSAEITHENLVHLMVGRDVSQFYRRAEAVPRRQDEGPREPLLQVKGLRTFAYPKHLLDFSVFPGEMVGIAGLVGAGRTEVLMTLFGIEPALDGEILVAGQVCEIHSARDAIAAGFALVPEDRKQQGLILEMAVKENLSLASLHSQSGRGGWLPKAYETALSRRSIADLNIKTPHDGQEARFLSGGNQQKVVLGKWLALKPKILLLDEPTRGIDVGAKAEIYRIMESLAATGVAIVFVSSEMEEVLGLSDRALIMHEGRISGVLLRDQLSEQSVMRLATGDTGKL